jgi:hypothetical protein
MVCMRLPLLFAVAALAIPLPALRAQRAPEPRFRATTVAAAAAAPTLDGGRRSRAVAAAAATTHRRVRKWPFVLVGALAGGALGLHYYVRRADAANDDDFFYPVSAAIDVGAGAAGGALGGLLVGSVVQVAAAHRR